MTPELQNRIDQLQAEIDLLKSEHTIPYEVESAFRERLDINGLSLPLSSKSATSENRTVDEAGASSYSVLKAPDGFLETVLTDGTVRYIPIYD